MLFVFRDKAQKMHRFILQTIFLCLAIFSAKTLAETLPSLDVGSLFVVPPEPRITINEDAAWRFKFKPQGLPQSIGYDVSSWDVIDLPHTWNAMDGSSREYAKGSGWYRKTINVMPSMAGKRLYLQFGAGALVTSLFIDGKQIDLNPTTPEIDSHRGGFQTFAFDVTNALNDQAAAGPDGHVIAVRVDNDNNPNIIPAGGGDYSKQGGLYRDASLIAVDPAHIALTQLVSHTGLAGADVKSLIASAGIQFSNSDVKIGAESASITIKTTLDNEGPARNVAIHSYLIDTEGVVRARQLANLRLEARQSGIVVSQNAVLDRPHLWDARIDPYLYTLNVEVCDANTGRLIDSETEHVGIRSFQINAMPDTKDPNANKRAAFMLNGHAYRLVGADMHQDISLPGVNGTPAGWARTDAQTRADIALFVQMGGTAIRTSHYQDSQTFYDSCDKAGIMVYTECPINGATNASDGYLINAQDQYSELILQNCNHPSIFAWGFGNETSGTAKGIHNTFLQLQAIAHRIDPSRKTGFAQYGFSISADGNTDSIPDIKGCHLYDYWYGGDPNAQKSHNAYPSQPLGVTEYGGGGSAYQYADHFSLPVAKEIGGVKTRFHPENQQVRLEELHYTDLSQLPFLWGQFTWQMFDNASTGKNEGDHDGLNDKGLVTRDRVPKDSYYFYKAALNDPTRAWSNERVLVISDRFWTARNSSHATVTVFSNIGPPTLFLNGLSLGQMRPLILTSGPNSIKPGMPMTIPSTYTSDITLAIGVNELRADRTYSDGKAYTDSAFWSYRDSLAGVPVARIDFLPVGKAATVGYSADTGKTYSIQGGQTYGWLPESKNVLPVGKAFGGDSENDPAANGIYMNYESINKTSSIWEYAIPNGVYDVRIGAGEPGKTDEVNNFAIEGKTAAIDSSGCSQQDTFYSRVTVADGRLTLSAAPGAINASIDFIDINKVSDNIDADSHR